MREILMRQSQMGGVEPGRSGQGAMHFTPRTVGPVTQV